MAIEVVRWVSCRAWGDLCAVWWNERHPDARVNYCKFAW